MNKLNSTHFPPATYIAHDKASLKSFVEGTGEYVAVVVRKDSLLVDLIDHFDSFGVQGLTQDDVIDEAINTAINEATGWVGCDNWKDRERLFSQATKKFCREAIVLQVRGAA